MKALREAAAAISCESSKSSDEELELDHSDNVSQHVENRGSVTEIQAPEIGICGSSSDEAMWIEIDSRCMEVYEDSTDIYADDTDKLKKELQAWAVDSKITHSQLNHLLPILGKYRPNLPVTAKTLLKHLETWSAVVYQVVITCISELKMVSTGCCVTKLHVLSSSSALELSINIDGLPLFSSSSYSPRPILCSFMNTKPFEMFVVALYGGTSKPVNLNFIEDTVGEMKKLLSKWHMHLLKPVPAHF